MDILTLQYVFAFEVLDSTSPFCDVKLKNVIFAFICYLSNSIVDPSWKKREAMVYTNGTYFWPFYIFFFCFSLSLFFKKIFSKWGEGTIKKNSVHIGIIISRRGNMGDRHNILDFQQIDNSIWIILVVKMPFSLLKSRLIISFGVKRHTSGFIFGSKGWQLTRKVKILYQNLR